MPHFDGTIALGSILSAVSIIGAGIVFFVRLGEIQRLQTVLMEKLEREFNSHQQEDDRRFDRLEARIVDLVSGLQRLVGQNEIRLHPRRNSP